MCAVLGLHSQDYIDLNLLKKILVQSMIRGKHATGIAYLENDEIKYKIIPSHAESFDIPDIATKYLIAHCRYSTSDLEYNQPIVSDKWAVVHNGVITQAHPSTWPDLYGYEFQTKCDSEIVLRSLEDDKHPLNLNGSMACAVLENSDSGALHFFRNEQRPLYFTELGTTTIVASTRDILARSGINQATKTQACYTYKTQNNQTMKHKVRDVIEDLQ
tara:strand:- start:566 stop:1213 length:648 start_codon:yes stop_codon:yes gene_type:complete